MLEVCQVEKIIENVSRLYIEKLEIKDGDIVAVVGPEGSGKTLLIQLLSGAMIPSGGGILLDGQDIYRHPHLRSQIGLMLEADVLYERMNARQNLRFYQELYQLPPIRVEEALTQIRLNDQADRPIKKLSRSAQRRLAFARTFMLKPRVYLFDQPILRTNLETQILMMEEIKKAASEGACVLLTGDDMAWMGRFATRVLEMHDGRIAAQSTIRRDTGQISMTDQDETIAEKFTPNKISARHDDRIIFFDEHEILYATSRDGKTILHTIKEEATSNYTLQELEQRLIGKGFFKSHRAYLVNLQHIKAIIQYTRNSYTLVLKDNEETMIPLSKQSERALSELMGY